ncbi:hypothetical protein PQX77_007357 [Marasmius sp. AFHP31]|nr:hypothetical protein PQX77_007357 [Marasmius sp. AFHP31]
MLAVSSSRSTGGSRNSRRGLEAMRFLDLEAIVDRDEEEEDDIDHEIAAFLDDEDDNTRGARFSHQALYSRLQIQQEKEDGSHSNINYSHRDYQNPDDDRNNDDPSFQDPDDQDRGVDDDRQGDGGSRYQSERGPIPPTPLLYIPKKEIEVVHYTMAYALAREVYDVILSIHYRKRGDGYLFVETNDPFSAARILGKCAFISHNRESRYNSVSMRRLEDTRETLQSLTFSPEVIERGTWVQLSNPKFGLPPSPPRTKPAPKPLAVDGGDSQPPQPPHASTDSQGSQSLEVEHQPTDPHDYQPPKPPPRSSRYHNKLALVVDVSPTSARLPTILVVPRFDEALLKAGVKAADVELGTPLLLTPEKVPDLDVLGLRVQHGLRVETVGRGVVVPLSEPPSLYEFAQFRASNHPLVMDHFPQIKQWIFDIGDSVCPLVGNWEGKVVKVTERGVEAVRSYWVSDGSKKQKVEEVRFFGWGAQKIWKIGQYVCHHTGEEGFIVGQEADEVFFWKGGEEMGANPYVGHRNSLREVQSSKGIDRILDRRRGNVTMEAMKLANVSREDVARLMSLTNDEMALDPQLMSPNQIDQGLKLVRTPGNPWKYWSVLVWKGRHRGHYHVLDVVVSTKTISHLMLQVRTEVVNAIGTVISVDYDHVVDAELLLPLHVIERPPFGLEPPSDYVHPGIAGLQKHRSRLPLQGASESQDTARASTPPPDSNILVDSTGDSAWDPEVSQELSNMPVTLPIAPERWKSTHATHHEFYELDRSIADLVSFQVKLHGTVSAFKDRKYTYNTKSSTWHSIYFREIHNPYLRKLALDWQRIRAWLPEDIVVYPQRPTKNTNLPLMVTRGEFKNMVVTKVAGVRNELYVLPVVPSTGEVDVKTETLKVTCGECCVVHLREQAHAKWRTFNAREWEASKSSAPSG